MEPSKDIDVRQRRAAASLAKKHPGRLVIDVTSRGPQPWVRFSPFFPHGGIPVPFSGSAVAASVEGIWQGLKVFENADVDEKALANTSMRGIKRTTRRFGSVRGHRRGISGKELLDYSTARAEIYLPTYAWVLEHRLREQIDSLVEIARRQPITLLDYETNCDLLDLRRPLSHAGLVAAEVRAIGG